MFFSRVRPALLVLVLGMGLTACGGNAQPLIVTIPPTVTFTATTTAEAFAPSAVPATVTPPPTLALTTGTPGPSPTHPLAPTLSPAPETLTATRPPTLAGLSITYFTPDSEAVKPGSTVTLFWEVRGTDRARIFRINAEGERLYRWDVDDAGKITVGTGTEDREVARFLLTAETGGSTIEQELLIPLQCPEIWFFDPAPDSCPAEPPQVSSQVEQTFEHGRMIWVASQDRIYIIFEDNQRPRWTQYPDNFEEGMPARDESLVPPANLSQPVRGFGLVWRENAYTRDRLGWAVSPEVPYEGMYQSDSVEPSLATVYLRMRDGGILALNSQTSEWEVLPPPASGAAASPAP